MCDCMFLSLHPQSRSHQPSLPGAVGFGQFNADFGPLVEIMFHYSVAAQSLPGCCVCVGVWVGLLVCLCVSVLVCLCLRVSVFLVGFALVSGIRRGAIRPLLRCVVVNEAR